MRNLHCTTNRTTLELKHRRCRRFDYHQLSTNRTTLELKQRLKFSLTAKPIATNRTTLELKHIKHKAILMLAYYQSHHTGIETQAPRMPMLFW